jgi:uncharacterized protein (TIGR02145 family)
MKIIMKTTPSVLLAGLFLTIFIGCNKETLVPSGTVAGVPIVGTQAVGVITATTAKSGGFISYDGGSAVTSRGVCWSTNHAPSTTDSKTTDGAGAGNFQSTFNGLTPHSIYYIRAYAVNNAGTGYGSELSFQTQGAVSAILFNPNLTYGSVTDIEGNVYKTIQIGTQTWMAENLKTTKYSNGDPITNETSPGDYNDATMGAYWWYNNDITNKATYGALYDWWAATDGRKIAPAGWHVPTNDEWTTLMNYLGGNTVAGGKLKETGITHWRSPNSGATNESGFTALPGGNGASTVSQLIEDSGHWWSSTQPVFTWHISSTDGFLSIYPSVNAGVSVRCVKD